jgi:large subunit ribosomal protein L7e
MGEVVKTVIPESVLKKRKREEEWALAKKAGARSFSKEEQRKQEGDLHKG